MNRQRRHLLITSLGALAALNTGCVTSRLYQDHQYAEKISSVLVSGDAKKIAILGKDFHYIFDAPANLVQLLKSPLQKKVVAQLSGFYVNTNHTITGRLDMVIGKKSSEDDKQEAVTMGFKPRPDGELSLQLSLQGTRYSATEFPNYADTHKLNKEYFVSIVARPSSLEKALKAPLTPITIALDGALILSAVILSPLLIHIVLAGH